MSICDIVEVDNSEMRKKVTELMAADGLSSNVRTIVIEPFPPMQMVDDEIKAICQAFGEIESQEVGSSSAKVTFRSTVSAYLCKDALNELELSELGIVLRVSWDLSQRTYPLIFFPKLEESQFPLPDEVDEASKTPIEKPKFTKYQCKFPISIPDDEVFMASRKLLGAKGCNFRKIIELCCSSMQLPDKPKDMLTIKLMRDPQLCVQVTSRYLDRYTKAVGLVEDLVVSLYDDFKRYCMEIGKVPMSLEVRKRERLLGCKKAYLENEEFKGHTKSIATPE